VRAPSALHPFDEGSAAIDDPSRANTRSSWYICLAPARASSADAQCSHVSGLLAAEPWRMTGRNLNDSVAMFGLPLARWLGPIWADAGQCNSPREPGGQPAGRHGDSRRVADHNLCDGS
jgi:hypothetical protein